MVSDQYLSDEINTPVPVSLLHVWKIIQTSPHLISKSALCIYDTSPVLASYRINTKIPDVAPLPTLWAACLCFSPRLTLSTIISALCSAALHCLTPPTRSEQKQKEDHDGDNVGEWLPNEAAALFSSNDGNELVIVSSTPLPLLTRRNYTFH